MIQVTSHLLLTGMLSVKYLELFIDSPPLTVMMPFMSKESTGRLTRRFVSHHLSHELLRTLVFNNVCSQTRQGELSGSITDGLRSLRKRDVWKEYQKSFLHSKETFLCTLPETKCFNIFSSSEASLSTWSLMAAGGWTNSYVLPWSMGTLKNTPLSYLKKFSDLSNNFIILIKTR